MDADLGEGVVSVEGRLDIEVVGEAAMKPYIVDMTWLGLRVIVHRRATLTEECATDDILRRGEADELNPRWHKCRWCWPAERAELPREALC